MTYLTQKNGQVSLKEAAEYFGYQANYFSRLCRKLFATDFVHLRRNIRINLAEDQLLLTNKKLEEIADELGYQDLSSFFQGLCRIHRLFARQIPEKIWHKNKPLTWSTACLLLILLFQHFFKCYFIFRNIAGTHEDNAVTLVSQKILQIVEVNNFSAWNLAGDVFTLDVACCFSG